jgi:hypothetical protein
MHARSKEAKGQRNLTKQAKTQTNKQTSKKTSKQTSEQTNKQANAQNTQGSRGMEGKQQD